MRVECVIVGGGIMGLATAWALNRRGERPIVLDRFGRGHRHGASHGATRNFNNAYTDAHYLDLLDARELADAWTTSGDVEATKPEPDLIHAALDRLDTERAVMVGDSTWDCKAARNAGVETLAVLTGGFSAQELFDAGALSVFGSLTELRERLPSTVLG